MIAILDTNAFRGDVYAVRPQLTDLFERADAADVELVVPRVVFDELVRQFPDRLRQVVRTVNSALANSYRELNALQLRGPEKIAIDEAAVVADYAKRLAERFDDAGVTLAEHPRDAQKAFGWAAQRRKPFKADSGLGLPDAAIWLTALEYAQRGEVVLVTANSSDFADVTEPTRPAPELETDLGELGSAGRVQIVESVGALAEKLVSDEERARERAEVLLDDSSTASSLIATIARALDSRTVPKEEMELEVELEDDPYIVAYDIDDLALVSATPLSGGRLLLDLTAQVTALVSFAIYKADAYGLRDDSWISIADWDWNEYYAAAELDGVALTLNVSATHSPKQPDWVVEIDELGVS